MSKFRKALILLTIAVVTQGCMRARLDVLTIPTARDIEPTQTDSLDRTTSTPLASTPPTPFDQTHKVPVPSREGKPAPTATEISATPLTKVTITSVKGNLYIRRGPGLEYNQIGVLLKDTSTEVIAHDVLSNWVQVVIPNSDNTGWVSIQTIYSKTDGDLNKLPDFTFTDWPLPAYIKNCTEHDMFITPGDIYLPNLYTNAQYKNEVQVNPGSYTAFDLFVPGEPEAQKFEIREGVEAYITINGLGVKHKCP